PKGRGRRMGGLREHYFACSPNYFELVPILTSTGGAAMTTTPTRVQGSLEAHGIEPVGTVIWNPTTSQLYTAALKSGAGILAHGRPLVADPDKFTGRSPNDNFVLDEPGSSDRIWWGEVNHRL